MKEKKIAVKIINMMIVQKTRQAENNEGIIQEKMGKIRNKPN